MCLTGVASGVPAFDFVVATAPSSVSPPPAQVEYLPVCGSAAVTHLKVLPASDEPQTQLVSDDSEPGTLSYMRLGSEGSVRNEASKPTPLMPAIVGCPKARVDDEPPLERTVRPAVKARPPVSVTCALVG